MLVAAMKNLNLKEEFEHLLSLIHKSWTGVHSEDFNAAAKAAFNHGLYDGRFWVDKFVNYRVGRSLNQSNSKLCPLSGREAKVNSTYDALCIFTSNIYAGLSQIEQSQMRFGKWSYCKSMDRVMADIRSKYTLKGIEPLQMPEAEQQALIKNYPGFDAAGSRTLPTPVKVSYADAIYSKENQGMSFSRTIISAIYSHGLGCAQEFNDRSLVEVLTGIYGQFRDSPFCVSNGESFVELARKAEFFMLLEAVSPFSFMTDAQYDADMAALNTHTLKLEAMTVDEKADHEESNRIESERLLDEILNELKQEEAGASQTLLERDALIESYRDRLSSFAF